MSYREEPKKILTYDVRNLRRKQILIIKVQWKRRSNREATREKEYEIR